MISQELQKKVEQSIKLLQTIAKTYDQPIEVAYSGGKDSDVILQLAKEAGIKYRAIYKNTTIDPPGTIAHVKEMGVEVRMPNQTFFELVRKRGFPTRMVRMCCAELKEYKILDKCIVGVRKDESVARKERYNEPTQCRLYPKGEKAELIYPILDWTLRDVTDFLKDRGIKCAPVYYDEQGKFHPERRLGCIGCPMSGNKLKELKQYPKFTQALIKAGQYRYEHAPEDSALRRNYKNAYEVFVQNNFYTSQAEFMEAKSGMFGEVDCKKFLEDYFGIKL